MKALSAQAAMRNGTDFFPRTRKVHKPVASVTGAAAVSWLYCRSLSSAKENRPTLNVSTRAGMDNKASHKYVMFTFLPKNGENQCHPAPITIAGIPPKSRLGRKMLEAASAPEILPCFTNTIAAAPRQKCINERPSTAEINCSE